MRTLRYDSHKNCCESRFGGYCGVRCSRFVANCIKVREAVVFCFAVAAMDVEAFARDQHPCKQEKQASFKCLDDNHYDKTKCQEQFDAYNACRKRWMEARAVLKRKQKEI
ncbi:hypothetical protein PTSG_03654 [Salpingoeca rosetta]|uniref:CHCH domain-containing protein n=1 Tax=Salpingoeca rosetta (strain ATCC 50818 / BSB-021) TaxID=946362 RepID=F2U677_SALR5|nr:uncharacterized protein PTSG_03654 [Salpingoeca rosetta]EGD83018.1 hypothetical protein PTSG_03654 [Salpingoeca rosetta]|eukprot:XP_004995382.1 hypothetical protein PTSG_03654 [Salpingoeca rosetta]